MFHDFNITQQQASMSQHSLTYECRPTAIRTEVAQELIHIRETWLHQP